MKLSRYLIPGERRVVVVRRHPAMFARVGAAAFLAVTVAVLETALSPGASRLLVDVEGDSTAVSAVRVTGSVQIWAEGRVGQLLAP